LKFKKKNNSLREKQKEKKEACNEQMSQPKAIDSASSFFLCKRVVNKENKI